MEANKVCLFFFNLNLQLPFSSPGMGVWDCYGQFFSLLFGNVSGYG